jgi:hypothetical protein
MLLFANGLFVLTTALLLLGAVALVAVYWYWESVEEYYSTDFLKNGVAAVRCLSAFAGILSRVVESADRPAVLYAYGAAGTGAIAWILWEFAQNGAEVKSKAAEASTKKKWVDEMQRHAALRRLTQIRSHIIGALRGLVNTKKERLSAAVPKSGGNSNPKKLYDFLGPDKHMYETIGTLAVLLKRLRETGEANDFDQANIRIGFYEPLDGHMVPLMGFDISDRRYNPFTSYQKHRDRFAVDNDSNPSHTVQCVRQKKTIIVPDTVGQGIAFFDESQKNYLRSLVAHPIFGIMGSGGKVADGAIVIDANIPGFFMETDRTTIELILSEFSSRLSLESYLRAFSPLSKGR